MPTQRATDSGSSTHFRSGRISTINGLHYFSTREGSLEGPYFSLADAEHKIASYIGRMQQAKALMGVSLR